MSHCMIVPVLVAREFPLPTPSTVGAANSSSVQKHKSSQSSFPTLPIISARMRAVLVMWMSGCLRWLEADRETLHIAIYIFDRCIKLVPSASSKHENRATTKPALAQLCAAAAMHIANKAHEIEPPPPSDWTEGFLERKYKNEDLHRMEILMLDQVGWNTTPITTIRFAELYLQAHARRLSGDISTQTQKSAYDKQLYVRVTQLLDFCTIDPSLHFNSKPSELAAAAVHLISQDRGLGIDINAISGYSVHSFLSHYKRMITIHKGARRWLVGTLALAKAEERKHSSAAPDTDRDAWLRSEFHRIHTNHIPEEDYLSVVTLLDIKK
eukprot:UC4_evm1s1232